LVVALNLPSLIFAQTREQYVKTVYLEKFANYIEWPVENNETDSYFQMIIVGDAEFCSIIQKAFVNRKIKGQKVRVNCLKEVKFSGDIDLLFLADGDLDVLMNAMALCDQDKFLIVSDSEGFASEGAHVNFFITPEQTIHFEMNKASLDKHNFEVDFLLLEYAKVVGN
jgi:hypothetical protein